MIRLRHTSRQATMVDSTRKYMRNWREVGLLGVCVGDRVSRTADILDVGNGGKRTKIARFLVMMSFVKIGKMGKNNFRGQYYVFFLRHECGEVKREGEYYHSHKTGIAARTLSNYCAYSKGSYM